MKFQFQTKKTYRSVFEVRFMLCGLVCYWRKNRRQRDCWGVVQLAGRPAVTREGAGSSPAHGTLSMWCSWLSSQALNLQTRVRCPAWTPAFVAQLAEHRTLNAKVAGSYPVDSLQSAMPQRSGAPLRMECNSQAGSTPVVDTSSHGVTVTQEVLIL